MRTRSNPLDLTGFMSGHLLVLRPVSISHHPSGGRRWECVCVCGQKKMLCEIDLLHQRYNSCGCLHDSSLRRYKSHRMSNTRTYRSWTSARCRVVNPRHHAYHRYGGAGVRMCKRWMDSFDAFFADMGTRPDGTSLDRINTHGDYEPGNCRWATPSEQARNRAPYGTFTAKNNTGRSRCGSAGLPS